MTLQTAYFAPIEYFAVLAKYSSVFIEAHETYQKQSYRNRFLFYAENGVQSLNFPIRHRSASINIPIKEVEVDYSTPWLQKTLRCLDTAYHSSAYYDYYRSELHSLLLSRPRTLWELNMAVTRFMMRKIGLTTELLETPAYSGEALDIHPKHPSPLLASGAAVEPYFQVFAARHGFKPALSTADLLFNEGPLAGEYLQNLL